MRRRPVHVETVVALPPGPGADAVVDRLWSLTQDPRLHPRWDVRFSSITPLGAGRDDAAGQRFRYALDLPHPRLPLVRVRGTGTSTSSRREASGRGTSALRWGSGGALSPLGPGSGWWRYVPEPPGAPSRVRFLTGYDYTPGWGWLGAALDPWLVRPLVGRATAWSFDRFRLWAERGLDPARTRDRWVLLQLARGAALTAALAGLRRGRGLLSACLALAAVGLPTPSGVPAASRCRRRPRDRGAVPPSSLAHLAAP